MSGNPTTALRGDFQRAHRDLRKRIAALANAFIDLRKQVAALATALSTAITAINDKTQRAATVINFPAPGSQDVTITWPNPWPDTAYWVGIELLTGAAALGAVHATLKAGSKTTTECVITVTATATLPTVGVDVFGVRT